MVGNTEYMYTYGYIPVPYTVYMTQGTGAPVLTIFLLPYIEVLFFPLLQPNI